MWPNGQNVDQIGKKCNQLVIILTQLVKKMWPVGQNFDQISQNVDQPNEKYHFWYITAIFFHIEHWLVC